jgi:hypothetical protein
MNLAYLLRMEDHLSVATTNKASRYDLFYHLVYFNTFEDLNLPIKGPMEKAGVITATGKLPVTVYDLSPTLSLYMAPSLAKNMVGRVSLIQLFLPVAGNSTLTIPDMYSKPAVHGSYSKPAVHDHGDSGFPMGCADAAAVDSGHDGRRDSNVCEVNQWQCQTLGAASHAWVD